MDEATLLAHSEFWGRGAARGAGVIPTLGNGAAVVSSFGGSSVWKQLRLEQEQVSFDYLSNTLKRGSKAVDSRLVPQGNPTRQSVPPRVSPNR